MFITATNHTLRSGICSLPSSHESMAVQETPAEIESWRSNDPLPEVTQKRIHELIVDAQCEIDSFDQEIRAIMDRRQQSISRMATLRTAVSSVKLLPSEIWIKIFTEYMDLAVRSVVSLPPTRDEGPWKLGHVCHRWRQALRGASELWNNISFHTPYRCQNWTRFESNLTESCLDVLSRQNSLITLTIPPYTLKSRAVVALAASLNHRLQSLDIRGLTQEDLRLLLELPSGSFDSLEILRLAFTRLHPWFLPFHTSSFQSALSLQMVEYTTFDSRESYECVHHLLLLPWSRLAEFRSTIWILIPAVHSLLIQASSLVHCELTINDNFSSNLPFQRFTLPNLESLDISLRCTLSWEDLLGPLILPALTSFQLRFHDTDPGYLGWPQALTSLITRSQCEIDTLTTECDYDDIPVVQNFVPLLQVLPSVRILEVMSIFGPDVFQTLIKEDLLPDLCYGTWIVTPDGLRSALEWLRACPDSISDSHTEIDIHCITVPGYGPVWREFLYDRDHYRYTSKALDVHLYAYEGNEVTSWDDVYVYDADEV